MSQFLLFSPLFFLSYHNNMTSLISNSILVMGDPNSRTPTAKQTSIPWSSSFKDWWNSSTHLTYAHTSSKNQEKLNRARLSHLLIENELFTAILLSDIDVETPTVSPNTKALGSTYAATSSSKITGEQIDVEIEPSLYIHEFYLSNKTDTSLPKLDIVIIHGYMAASGYFIKNVESLIKSYDHLDIHILDLPGFGNSSRPKFPVELLISPMPNTIKNQIAQIIDIECWFIDKLEEWRTFWGLKKFKLMGHSMGAYLASCYLMKYNNQYGDDNKLVDEFVIISPLGTESSSVSLINSKMYQFNHHGAGGDPFKEIFTKQANPEEKEEEEEDHSQNEELLKLWEKLGKPKFPKNLILTKLWQWNKSPFQLLQTFGPFYSKLLSYWSFQRFRNLKANDLEFESVEGGDGSPNVELILKLHNYSYSIFNQYQGSGELAITKIINQEMLPRLPLCDRGFVEFINESNLKTLWLYGDKDWMNQQGGKYCVDKLLALGNKNTRFEIIKDAGHHIYLDNPSAFNSACIEFLQLKD